MTQKDLIMKYINDFGTITSYQAFTDLGITRLSARISELEEMGVRFTRAWEKKTNRYGEPVQYIRYGVDDGR